MLEGGQVCGMTTMDIFIDVDPFIDAEDGTGGCIIVIVDSFGDVSSVWISSSEFLPNARIWMCCKNSTVIEPVCVDHNGWYPWEPVGSVVCKGRSYYAFSAVCVEADAMGLFSISKNVSLYILY